jgi:hypothetical protein
LGISHPVLRFNEVPRFLGHEIFTKVSRNQAAGDYQIKWDASEFSNGVYLYILTIDDGFTQTRKLALLK